MPEIDVLLMVGMPWLSTEGRRILLGLVRRHGYPGPADSFAASVGLRNRYQLSRTLQRESLPCLEELAGWIRVLTWVITWETSGVALTRSALTSLRDPAPMFRLVERLTGHTWTRVRAFGSDWVLLQLVQRCKGGPVLDNTVISGEASGTT
jgi:hypothetical protein